MRQAIFIAIAALAACSGRESGGNADGASVERGDGGAVERASSVQTTDLTGLYEEAPGGGQRARMCVVSKAGTVAFGIVTETPDGGSCAGAGEAKRIGGVMRLTMGGDQQCVIDAKATGTAVTFPATVGPGCAYYCAPGATLAGEAFEKTGGTTEDAMRATDLAGDPLCG